MLNLKNAIRVEKYYPPGGNGGPKNQHIFKCIQCDNEIKVKALKRLKTATGLCVKCNNLRMHPQALKNRRLRPYENMFNRVKDSAHGRQIECSLKYEQFLDILSNKCHYCHVDLLRKPYGFSTYHLDRKNNDVGYELNNLVNCCEKCNKGKRELYSYQEWYGMTAYFRNKENK